jgi:hypothetical protein
MMFTAERLQLVAKEQYGSRKGKAAIEQCLNKRLTFDLARQLKRPLAMCSNDAKSCYDRIVHSVASLSMRRMGVEAQPIICMFTTIQNLEHYIRTVYGDSELSFTGKLWAVPIQGVGQGNGAGPQIWAVVSTPVLNMLRHEGYGVYFRTAITGTTISFVGYAFVDDTDLCVTTVSPDDTLPWIYGKEEFGPQAGPSFRRNRIGISSISSGGKETGNMLRRQKLRHKYAFATVMATSRFWNVYRFRTRAEPSA